MQFPGRSGHKRRLFGQRRHSLTRKSQRLAFEQLQDRRVLATFTVTTLGDVGTGSLREAINMANASAEIDTIDFAVQGTIAIDSQLPTITNDLIIEGPGADNLTIDAQFGPDREPQTSDGYRVFEIFDGSVNESTNKEVEISGLTLTGGDVPFGSIFDPVGGGAIQNEENLLLVDSVLTENASGQSGGALFGRPGSQTEVVNVEVSNNRSGDAGGIGTDEADILIRNSTIIGNTAGSAGGGLEAFYSNVTIEDTTVSNNSAFFNAGGLRSSDSIMIVRRSTITFNTAGTSGGGGINSGGFDGVADLTVEDSVISNNVADEGAGLRNAGGVMNIYSSTVTGNSAGRLGGALYNRWAGSVFGQGGYTGEVTMTNTTISGNTAAVFGGAIFNNATDNPDQYATVNLISTTVTANSAGSMGGGIVNETILSLENTIVAANSAPNADDMSTSGTTTGIFNLVGIGDGSLVNGTDGNIVGTPVAPIDPLLGPLADNGGLTLTHALLPGSPATDSGNPSPTTALDFDQRGMPFERVFNDVIDMGAIEDQAVALACDFSGDGFCTGIDIDMLQENIVIGPADPLLYDLTGDGQVTLADRDEWLVLAGAENLASGAAYLLGDANLDGTVDGLDFILWNENRFSTTTAWTRGDFDVDGVNDGEDFIIWNMNRFMSSIRPGSNIPNMQAEYNLKYDPFASLAALFRP